MDKYIEGNKAAWEEAFENRDASWGADITERVLTEDFPFFNEDTKSVLKKCHTEGAVIGQFCCNNGRELLSLVKSGKAKKGVGFDIAENQVAFANEKAKELCLPCTFEAVNIYDMDERYREQFDLVIITIGALCWFADLKRFQITEVEYEAIKAKAAATKDKNISRRLRALILWYEGKSLKQIGEILSVHPMSVNQMCKRYREQGIEEYARNKYTSHWRLLSEEEEAEILDQFRGQEGKQVTAREIKAALDKACGKDTGRAYVYRVLERNGWSKKMPRSKHPKAANEVACEASKKLKPACWTPKTVSQNETSD